MKNVVSFLGWGRALALRPPAYKYFVPGYMYVTAMSSWGFFLKFILLVFGQCKSRLRPTAESVVTLISVSTRSSYTDGMYILCKCTKKSARGFKRKLFNLIKWWHSINEVSIVTGIQPF